jgi:hypothetical protein
MSFMNKPLSLICFGILALIALPVFAVQTADRAYFTADKLTVVIGEPIQLVLHLRVPQNAQLSLPDFPKTLSHFAVENVGSLNLAQQFDDGGVEYQLPLQVILWRTGTYQTPPLSLSYQLSGANSVNLTVEALQFEVLGTLKDDDLSLRPFKSSVNLPYVPLWQIILIALVFISAGIILVRKYLVPKQSTFIAESFMGHPDAAFALKSLRQIESSNESSLVIYTQVADCLRGYLSKRYFVQALDLTTSELVDQLNEKGVLADEYQQKLAEMLKRADLVKFARVVPKQGAAQQYASVASQWVQAVEQSNVEQAT